MISGKDCEKSMSKIQVLSRSEFAALEEELPFKKQLEKNLEHVSCCKVEVYPPCVLGVLQIPDKSNLEDVPECLGYYIKENRVLLIHGESERDLEKVREIEKKMVSEKNGTGEFWEIRILLLLFQCLIEQEIPYLQKFEEKITEAEHILLNETPQELPYLLMRLRKGIMKLHNFYVQLTDIGEELQGDSCRLISKEQLGEWNIFTNRVSRLHDYTENIRENLLQMHELYQSQIDVRQNEIMTVLAVVTAVFMPLSLLAGWYGMNFPNMLLLNWKYGYLTIVILTGVVIGLELLYFYKKGFFKRVLKKM